LSLNLAQEIDHQHGIGRALADLAYAAIGESAYEEAYSLLERSVAVLREIEAWDELGWTLANMAYVERALGRPRRAKQCLCETMQIAADIGAWIPATFALPPTALVLADQGEAERAAELYALVLRYPNFANSRWLEDIAGQQMATVTATLPPDVALAAQERGRSRDLETTAIELFLELKVGLSLPDSLSRLARPLSRILRPVLAVSLRRKTAG
jgi:tetratricopeptide (TPR) repeat protein